MKLLKVTFLALIWMKSRRIINRRLVRWYMGGKIVYLKLRFLSRFRAVLRKINAKKCWILIIIRFNKAKIIGLKLKYAALVFVLKEFLVNKKPGSIKLKFLIRKSMLFFNLICLFRKKNLSRRNWYRMRLNKGNCWGKKHSLISKQM